AGRRHVPLPSGFLAQGEQRAPYPDHRPTLRRGQWRANDKPTVARSIGIAGMGTVPNAGPVRCMGLDPLAKLFVFRTRAREHGDEAAASAIDMVHVRARTQLGISDVEEVRPTRHGTQCVPSVDMGAGIAGVAIAAAKGDGDTAV